MVIRAAPNVVSKGRVDIGTAVRLLIQFYRGSPSATATGPTKRPSMKARRGCHVFTDLAWNHCPSPYRHLAGPRPLRKRCIHAALALMSILLAASCATHQESAQPSIAAPAITPQSSLAAPAESSQPSVAAPAEMQRAAALSMPTRPRTRASRSSTSRASYQGNSTAGDRTASGEPYDPKDLTAASSTLPIGSSVMVTDPATGHSVKVRINDRSRKAHGRSLDLSKHAAEELGMTKRGVARVKVKRVDSEPAKSESHDAPAGSATPQS
jgi:rare lipoprotein A